MSVAAPNVRGLTQAAAVTAIEGAGLTVGTISFAPFDGTALGCVATQDPPGGLVVPAGTKVLLSVTAIAAPFDYLRTVISQYANSATIGRLIDNMDEYVNPRANLQAFYDFVWNVDTAQGFGLDIWGRIVGVSRLVVLPNDGLTFGFRNASVPQDWKPFGGGTFHSGATASQAYFLPDSTYRVLILAKGLANIAATTAPAMNRLIQNLFPGRGRAYVQDLGGMAFAYVFQFAITLAEYAILTSSGVMPHPAGVRFSVVVIAERYFGFSQQAEAVPFNEGVFYSPPS